MKKITLIAVIFALVLSMLSLTACGKSEFGLSESSAKRMTITAENASKDAFFLSGSLEVASGEMIVISADLTKGTVRVEIVPTAEEQSIDELPDLNAEAILTANLHSTDQMSGTVPAGNYMLRATCLEKATGTVQLEVLPDPAAASRRQDGERFEGTIIPAADGCLIATEHLSIESAEGFGRRFGEMLNTLSVFQKSAA